MKKGDFHIHSLFCDGNDNPEDIICEAVEQGFEAIGFSSHAYTPFDLSYCMSIEKTKKYISLVKALKEKYEDKIKIYLGIERDLYDGMDSLCLLNEFDYQIGSVHYLLINGEYYPVDESAKQLKELADKCFGGNIYSVCRVYYESVSMLADKINPDIIGHFDLITKFCEKEQLFDMQNKRYLEFCEDAVKYILRKHPSRIFEINTGAISRGYRALPYPQLEILRMIKKYGGRIIINSDAHSKAAIGCCFENARKLAFEAGFEYSPDCSFILK